MRTSRTGVQRCRTAGWSIVELLVVIFIISVLVSLLLPVLSRVRSAAAAVRCATNLRQVGTLTQVWTSGHDGYLPLDGPIELRWPRPGESLPTLLGDPARRRYDYSPDDATVVSSSGSPLNETPTPCLIAVVSASLPSAGRSAVRPGNDWETLAAAWRTLDLLHCPAARPQRVPPGSTQRGLYSSFVSLDGLAYPSPWYTTVDYATNGNVVGFHDNDRHAALRARGLTSRIERPSEVMLVAETDDPAFSFHVQLDAPAGDGRTLAGLFAAGRLPSGGRTSAQPVFSRHRGKMNILFADGHVAAFTAQADLTAVRMTAR